MYKLNMNSQGAKQTLLAGLVLWGLSALAQGSSSGAPGSNLAGYDIVLGSYEQRDIALRELAEFAECKQPLFVRVVELDERTLYRVVDHGGERFSEAQIVLGVWQACGLTDAWIQRNSLPGPR